MSLLCFAPVCGHVSISIMHGSLVKLPHLCACNYREHFNCFTCCSVACKLPSGHQIPIISISVDISSELVITHMENQCNNNHVKQLFLLLLGMLCTHIYVYMIQIGNTVCVSLITQGSQHTDCGGRKHNHLTSGSWCACTRGRVSIGWAVMSLRQPGHTAKFSLIWSHQSIDLPCMTTVRIALSCWLQAQNKWGSSFTYALQRIWLWVLSHVQHNTRWWWFNMVGGESTSKVSRKAKNEVLSFRKDDKVGVRRVVGHMDRDKKVKFLSFLSSHTIQLSAHGPELNLQQRRKGVALHGRREGSVCHAWTDEAGARLLGRNLLHRTVLGLPTSTSGANVQ